MGAGPGAWAGVVGSLAAAHRVLVAHRRGYGASPAPDDYAGTTVLEQAEDLAALLAARDAAPALLVGRDFGALACLDLLLRRPELARGAVLVAPPLLSLVPEGTDALTAERIALGERLHEGGPRAAMEAWLGVPSPEDPASFFADWAGLASLPVTHRELHGVALPVVVLTGAASPPHVRHAAAALARALPAGELREGEDVLGAVGAVEARSGAGGPTRRARGSRSPGARRA